MTDSHCYGYPLIMAIRLLQQGNKMFDRLLDRNERQLRQEKSKLYRQMLDNQIILNEQYRRKQQEAEVARFTPHLKQQPSPVKRTQSYEQEQLENRRKPVNKIRLPLIEDKQTHYEGHSNFISPRDAPTIRKAPPSRIKAVNSRLSSEEDSESEDIEDILSELKTLSKELANSKQRKRRKLSKFDGNTLRQHKKRQERTMGIDHTRHSQADVARPSRNREKLGTGSNLNPIRNGSLSVKTEPDSNPQQGAGSESAVIRWEQQRDKFIQILKKVRNRGESLFLKLSKFPKQ